MKIGLRRSAIPRDGVFSAVQGGDSKKTAIIPVASTFLVLRPTASAFPKRFNENLERQGIKRPAVQSYAQGGRSSQRRFDGFQGEPIC